MKLYIADKTDREAVALALCKAGYTVRMGSGVRYDGATKKCPYVEIVV